MSKLDDAEEREERKAELWNIEWIIKFKKRERIESDLGKRGKNIQFQTFQGMNGKNRVSRGKKH